VREHHPPLKRVKKVRGCREEKVKVIKRKQEAIKESDVILRADKKR
jgi:hypothetical protein